MIITGTLLGLGGAVLAREIHCKKELAQARQEKRDKREFISNWNTTMQYHGMKNKNEQTFQVLKYIPKYYGCDAIISIPKGKNYKDFRGLIPMIQSSYGSTIVSNLSPDGNSIYIRVAHKASDLNTKDNAKFMWLKILVEDDKCFNVDGDTYTLDSLEEKEYGFKTKAYIPSGLSFKELEALKDKFENAFKGKIYFNPNRFDNSVEVYIVIKELPDDYKYEPIKCDYEKFYIGMTYYYEPVFINLKVLSHMMYSGNTNTGKTVCLMTGLTNLIHSYRDGAFSLYLAMISAKKDLKIFANTKPCKFFAKTIEESYYMFFHLREIMLQRNKMFEGDSTVMNLYDWNKKYKDRQVKPIFVATDEISFYMPTDMDSDDVKDLKNKCRSLMWELLKEGRNCGIHFFSCLQRPDTNSFPAPMKALIGGKVCFYQPNTASSLVVLDSTEATNLRKQREAIVDGEEKLLMKTLYLTPEMIEMHLKDQIEENHKHLNLCNRIESNKENNKEENNVNNDKKHDKSETKNENKATNTANSTKSKEKASSRIKIKK